MDYPVSKNEEERLRVLHKLKILDTADEQQFDHICEVAQYTFNVPTVVISLVDNDRQWFKSHLGLDACSTERKIAFCNYAVLGSEVFEVCDASKDERFMNNPLVTGDLHLRYYCGAPIIAYRQAIGSFCLIDYEPRAPLSDKGKKTLSYLADMVSELIQARHELKLSIANLATLINQLDQND